MICRSSRGVALIAFMGRDLGDSWSSCFEEMARFEFAS